MEPLHIDLHGYSSSDWLRLSSPEPLADSRCRYCRFIWHLSKPGRSFLQNAFETFSRSRQQSQARQHARTITSFPSTRAGRGYSWCIGQRAARALRSGPSPIVHHGATLVLDQRS